MDYAQTREVQADQIGRQEDYASQTQRLNPEDIELARKKAELGLYSEKAAALEKEFTALRRSLVEFRDRFKQLIGSKETCSVPHPPAGIRALSAGRLASSNTIPFPVSATPSKAGVGATKAGKDAAPANAYLPIITAVRDELFSDVLTTLLDEDVLGARKIPQASFTLITGTAPAHYSERLSGSTDKGTGDALITVIREIYAARERMLFLHRGTMKLQFSMLHRFMTAVQEAQEVNVYLLGSIAGVSDRVISSKGMER
jgi:hypothetical protein